MDEVIIVTGDRDLLQLVDDKKGIKVFMPVKGLAEGKVFGEIEAKEKFGVVPTLIPDYKGLAGDQSDNYPGVAGIGPKTAAGLVEKFGSIEGVYRELEEKGKRKKEKGNEHLTDRVIEKLKKGKESALLSKNLATIRTDAPIDVSFDKMKVATLITPQARMKLAEFGFKSLLKRLSGESDMKKSEKPKKVSAEKPKKHDEEQLTLV